MFHNQTKINYGHISSFKPNTGLIEMDTCTRYTHMNVKKKEVHAPSNCMNVKMPIHGGHLFLKVLLSWLYVMSYRSLLFRTIKNIIWKDIHAVFAV